MMNKILLFIASLLFSHSIFAQTFDVDTIQYNGNTDKFINLVILGDGYLESELPQFIIDANNFSDYFFNVEPYSFYKNYFNVFFIKVPSNVTGAAMDPDNLIDNYYGSTFWYYGIERLLVPTRTSKITGVLSSNFPEYDQVVMLVNSSKYGGSGGWIATASTNASSNEVALHELGHSFANLIDEYWAGDAYAREGINMTQETDLANLRWKSWYGDNGIGLYPHTESPSWYRPHQSCKMRALDNPFCSVCTEAIIEKIHTLVSPLESYLPINNDISSTNYPIDFSISLINPEPNTLKRVWKLNEQIVGYNINELSINETDLNEGLNTLTATVEDTTALLRVDNHETIHLSTVTWQINKTTGINEVKNNEIVINFFPNPVTNQLNIQINSNEFDSAKIKISNLQGRIVGIFPIHNLKNKSINIEKLEQGIYILDFYINGMHVSSRKMLKLEY